MISPDFGAPANTHDRRRPAARRAPTQAETIAEMQAAVRWLYDRLSPFDQALFAGAIDAAIERKTTVTAELQRIGG